MELVRLKVGVGHGVQLGKGLAGQRRHFPVHIRQRGMELRHRPAPVGIVIQTDQVFFLHIKLMLTFENVLKIFQEYLLRDPEEEVLPCKRGYVRLTWDKDSRYCVDGILCRTPEELFDILLSDFQDFAMICRTRGRREGTEADEKAEEELCQPYLDWRKEALK